MALRTSDIPHTLFIELSLRRDYVDTETVTEN